MDDVYLLCGTLKRSHNLLLERAKDLKTMLSKPNPGTEQLQVAAKQLEEGQCSPKNIPDFLCFLISLAISAGRMS